MNFLESLRISWRSITSHKLRSSLTTLGVTIGIGAVIAFAILGAGFEANVIGDANAQSEPTLLVYTEKPAESGTGVRVGDTPVFTDHDREQLAQLDSVEYVAPQGSLPAVQVEHGEQRATGGIEVEATTPERFQYVEFREGEVFESGTNEAVINQQVNQRFEANLSTGDELTITLKDGTTRTVVISGVLNESVQVSPTSEPAPRISVPVDPNYNLTIEAPGGDEQRAYPFLQIRAERISDVDATKEAAVEYLQSDSDAADLKQEEYSFTVQTVSDLVDQITGIIDQLTGFIVGIAAIALIVGSIGIANIMLVSVTERTREIGIMKAIGAQYRDVMQLFLVESIILGLIGAFLGVLLGVGGGYLGVSLLEFPMQYPTDWIVIAVAVGVAVGIVSGLYPAWRAARVDPIEALRHE